MPRLYALHFRSKGTRRWTRGSKYAHPKAIAVRAFQTYLLAPFTGALSGLEIELRPVKEREAEGAQEALLKALKDHRKD
jgi:hypothetical protein